MAALLPAAAAGGWPGQAPLADQARGHGDLLLAASSSSSSSFEYTPRSSHLPNGASRTAIKVVDYAYPILLLVFFLAAFTARSVRHTERRLGPPAPALVGPGGRKLPPSRARLGKGGGEADLDFSRTRKLLFQWINLLVAATFVANAANVVLHAVAEREQAWWCGKAAVFYIVGGFFVWTLFLLSLIDSKPSPTYAHAATWLVAIVMEALLLAFTLLLYTDPHRLTHPTPSNPTDGEPGGRLYYEMSQWEILEVVIDCVRISALLFLVGFYVLFVSMRHLQVRREREQRSAAGVGAGAGAATASASAADSASATNPPAGFEAVESTRLLDDVEPVSSGAQTPVTNGHAGHARAGGAETASPNGTVSATTAPTEQSYVQGPDAPAANGTTAGKPAVGDVEAAVAAPGGSPAGWERPKSLPEHNWWEYLRGYSVLFPYLWPSKDRKLKVVVVLALGIVGLQRLLNLIVPGQVGEIVNILAGEDGPPRMPWGPVALLIFYKLLQGGSGVLSAARSLLWIPVSQYSFREISVAAFEHVHSLDLDFHLGKKTGEVVSALGKGAAINTFLDSVTFQVLPMIVDLSLAVGYFIVKFDSYYALVLAIVTFWYIYVTIRLAKWRGHVRRMMTNADREQDAVKNDSMMSYETVKYFNAETWEFERYRAAVNTYLKYEWQVTYSLNYLNVCQNSIFTLGLMAVCFIAAYQITTGEMQVGKFTTLFVYMSQLQAPLNFFGTFYRLIQNAMVNAERMLELLKLRPNVFDAPGVAELRECEGKITFKDVVFSYNARKPALAGLSFTCAPGTTTALVGESGGGKSTVFRLLFRFYNATGGSIAVDDTDVQDLSIDSVRRHIGVVPQDTILFNDTLMYNLRYANREASDEQIYDACRAASIHDRIMGFPDKYETQVGERGLRLSGGEKQRVAIARTIIKDPRIIMLDEATAALDTDTEQHIQESFDTLGRGRTMLVIAHRLSTITTADNIIVLHAGRVAEQGTHDQLLAKRGGRYTSMWKKQVRVQKAAQQAAALTEAAGEASSEHSENEGR